MNGKSEEKVWDLGDKDTKKAFAVLTSCSAPTYFDVVVEKGQSFCDWQPQSWADIIDAGKKVAALEEKIEPFYLIVGSRLFKSLNNDINRIIFTMYAMNCMIRNFQNWPGNKLTVFTLQGDIEAI